MRFIRKNGRVIPIRDSEAPRPRPNYAGAAEYAAGAALSMGSGKLGKLARRAVGARFGIATTLASVFAGEWMAAEGSDTLIESLHVGKHEQLLKNTVSGIDGLMGAVPALGILRRRRK